MSSSFIEYCPITKIYMTSSDRDYRKTKGQFFTSHRIREQLWNTVIDAIHTYGLHVSNMLEPSVGTGEFLFDIPSPVMDSIESIDCVEEDSSVLDMWNIVDFSYINADIDTFEEDFLTLSMKKTYNLIVGNPPYFELNTIDNEKREKYKEIDTYKNMIIGRSNIYVLFILRCIELLSDNGICSLVIPMSLKASPSFSSIRKKIIETCTITHMADMGQFDEDTGQDVMVFTIVKSKNLKPQKNYVHTIAGDILFGNISDQWTERLKQCIYLKNMKCDIRVGEIVWNQKKEWMNPRENENPITLIYGENIGSNGDIVLSEYKKEKGIQYIYPNEPISPRTAILVPRTVSKKCNQFRCALVKNSTFFAENHVYVIMSEDINVLTRVYNSFKHPWTLEYILLFLGTLNISKEELLRIPIFT